MQLEKTFEPGVLRVWAVTDQGEMFKVDLNVNKQVYINSKVANDDTDLKKVQKTLPRNRKTYHLYLWESTEQNF